MPQAFLFSTLVLFFCVSAHCQVKYNYGDMKSSTLTSKAWAALEVQDWAAVEAYTEKCIGLYSKKAQEQQANLTTMPPASIAFNYWALNDVGTCYFIKAKALKQQGKIERARRICELVANEYSFAQCWDPNGPWFWSVAQACNDMLLSLKSDVDFEDYTSETLTRKAWESFGGGNYTNAIIYANKCIELYDKDAKKQQESLTTYAPKEKAFDYWALNDVGTCHFVLGETYSKQKEWKKAVDAYEKLVNEYSYSQCWDPRGWFWKPAVAARGKLNKIKAEQGIS
jgi:tetratricopeptide (TPR) repeat protein